MGIFKKLLKVADDVIELTDDESQGTGVVYDKPPVELRPDATSAADLAALHAASGGRSGRATVQWTSGAAAVTSGEFGGGGTESVHVIVRERTLDGGSGPIVETRVWLPHEAALLMGAGLEVPITRDPATGLMGEVDRKALIEELRPQFAQALADEKAARSMSTKDAVAAIREGYADMRQADAEAAAQPVDNVEGVTADQWLQARRALASGRIPDSIVERTVTAYGVPPGRWADVDAAWSARAAADPTLAARLASL